MLIVIYVLDLPTWNGDIDYPSTVCIVSTVSLVIEELCKKH
jgi:hypothetical protein